MTFTLYRGRSRKNEAFVTASGHFSKHDSSVEMYNIPTSTPGPTESVFALGISVLPGSSALPSFSTLFPPMTKYF